MINTANDLYLAYSFVKRLTTPFEKWDAFRLGVIDEYGNVLISKNKRSQAQKKAFGLYDLMILNMKKILAKIPGGGSRFATYSAALFLIKEEQEIDEGNFIKFINEMTEEVVNSVGGHHIAGINSDDSFMGHKVFKVKTDVISKNRRIRPKHSRYKRYVGDDDIGEQIRDYARKNFKKGVCLQDDRTGEVVFLRRNPPK